ncbi:hypothetical protein HPG69_010889, partial [Diceros bicornis minor]
PQKARPPLLVSLCSESSVTQLPLPLDPGKVDVKRNVLIFDLGRGLFYVSIPTIQDGIIDVKSTTEDTSLSEEYHDNQMYAECILSSIIKASLRSSPSMKRLTSIPLLHISSWKNRMLTQSLAP